MKASKGDMPENHPSLAEATAIWLKIGFLSFGGPAGQIGLMHRLLVEDKRWVGEEQFLHALNFCMLLPGPEAQQLATYCGWLLHGRRGGLIAGTLFFLPGLVLILLLSTLYAGFSDTHWLASLFFGLKAAVLSVVVEALIRVGRRSLVSRFHRVVAGLSFLALFLLDLSFPLVVLGAGVAGYVAVRTGFIAKPKLQKLPALKGKRPRKPKPMATLKVIAVWLAVWMLPLPLLWWLPSDPDLIAEVMTGSPNTFATLFLFFSKLAMVTFGGAYAVLAYVSQTASSHFAWLNAGEMLDGLALAETTPGPLVLVLSFVGFLAGYRNPGGFPALAGGLAGGVIAAWATFLPSFLWIFAGAPYIERLRTNRALSGALSAVTAAVTGVILNLSIWFALHVLFSSTHRIALLSRSASTGAGSTDVALVSLPFPDITSLNPAVAVLALVAALMMFRLHAGIVRTLGLCAVLGWVWQIIATHWGLVE
nr:chromate efflux transporter [uncultured Gellertiella sp.]